MFLLLCLIRRKKKSSKKYLFHNFSRILQRQLDEVAFNYEDLLSAITSQTRRVMKRMKEDLAESLIQAGQ